MTIKFKKTTINLWLMFGLMFFINACTAHDLTLSEQVRAKNNIHYIALKSKHNGGSIFYESEPIYIEIEGYKDKYCMKDIDADELAFKLQFFPEYNSKEEYDCTLMFWQKDADLPQNNKLTDENLASMLYIRYVKFERLSSIETRRKIEIFYNCNELIHYAKPSCIDTNIDMIKFHLKTLQN